MVHLFLALFSALTASVLSSVLAQRLSPIASNFLFRDFNIPSLTVGLAQEKTLDIVEFPIFLLIGMCIFVFFTYLANKKRVFPKAKILSLSQFIFGLIFYFQTLFVDHSGSHTLLIAFAVCLVFAITWRLLTNESPDWKISIWGNGLLLGFHLLILGNIFLPTKVPGITAFFLTPLLFIVFSKKNSLGLTHPAFLLLISSAFFPFNKFLLFSLGFLVLFLFVCIPYKNLGWVNDKYPKFITIAILFVITFNPLFYFGTFDTIEEGFWLGWLQRLLNGEFIYRDFAAYHPPLLLWGLRFFTFLIGTSIYSTRLYFHLLQILGVIVIYFILSNLTKNNWIKISIFILILSYGSNLVRNNMEIRLAAGLLPLTLIHTGNIKKRNLMFFLGGAFLGASFFISLEVGLASFIAALTFLFTKALSTKGKILVLMGTLVSFGLILTLLATQNAFIYFMEYLLFYSKAFAQGYLNSPLQRPETLTLLQWYKVNQFIGSSGFLFEIVKIILIISLFYIATKFYHKTFSQKTTLLTSLVVFTIILTRSALGRSDSYHIAFVWIPTLIILGYLLEKLKILHQNFAIAFILLLILLIARDPVQTGLIQQQIIKLQTYGNPSGNYPGYNNERAKILTGIEVDTKRMDETLDYIQGQTTPHDSIFVFPLAPEIYFLTNRKNATHFDTPTAFFTERYQIQMIDQLKNNQPKLVIYNKDFSLSGLTANSLQLLNNYLQTQFNLDKQFGSYSILKPL